MAVRKRLIAIDGVWSDLKQLPVETPIAEVETNGILSEITTKSYTQSIINMMGGWDSINNMTIEEIDSFIRKEVVPSNVTMSTIKISAFIKELSDKHFMVS